MPQVNDPDFSTWDATSDTVLGSGWTGLLIGAVVFAYLYRDTTTKTVTFDCMPWQAPNGGYDCDRCNEDARPCSEYRCRSLGQSCKKRYKRRFKMHVLFSFLHFFICFYIL